MASDAQNAEITRRRFLARSVKAGLCTAAACALGYWRYDSDGPGRESPVAGRITFPDYSLPDLGPVMSIVTGAERKAMLRAGHCRTSSRPAHWF
ncbi:MAG: hypothetical protein JRK53_11920 [Deltaproteobacteria bacterium]|nr:hypothetical protein [Deltaproteobacteria bacterium]